MVVLATAPIIRLSWEGYENRALPIGAWKTDISATGDASGGTVQLSAQFTQAGAKASGLAYSVEQFAAQSTEVTEVICGARSSGFDQLFQIGMSLISNGFDALVDGRHLNLPWFLGQLQVPVSGQGLLTVTMTNTNTISYTVSLMGYVWSERSILARGGYQRPVTAPWG